MCIRDRGGGGARCAVAKDACDAVQGRKMRKKCGRVSTKRCQCSLNSGKKRGKCGACVESFTGVGAPSPTGTPLPPDPACPRGVKPGTQDWTAITSSSDGTKLAAVVYGGNIWTSCDSGQSWTERSVRGTATLENWQDITSSSEGVKLAAVVNGGGIWTSTDSGQSWTEWTGIETSWKSMSLSLIHI